MLSDGGLFVSPVLHPFVIIRAKRVHQHLCPRLGGCIQQLRTDRAAARARLEAEIGFTNTETDAPDLEEVRDGAMDDIEMGPSVQVLVVFEENPDD